MPNRDFAATTHPYLRSFLSTLAIVALWIHPSFGVVNSLTITEKAGLTTANYPLQIARPFVRGEIPSYPQAILMGTPLTTQADVKTRWPDGSVKHAILTFLIPTLTANSTVTVTFQNQATGNNGGYLNTAGMLDAAYDFDARMALTNGPTITTSARTMLTANAYDYWLQGSVATSIILADHSASRVYDVGFDGNRAFRPIFHATFWPTIKKVRVRFIGEGANTEALEDQTYALTLSTGSESPQTVYAKSSFTHTAATRWTKEFWIGAAPSAIAINHNLAYLASTTLVPNFDTSKQPSESALAAQYSTWLGRARDLYDPGDLVKAMGTAGGRPDIGPYPTWTVLWLYTGDARLREKAFGNADLAAAFPVHLREGSAAKYLDRARTTPGLGRVLSISTRPTICLACGLNYAYTVPSDRVTVVGPVTNGGWTPDTMHNPDLFSPQYMLTGDFWYLEEMYFWSSWIAGFPNGAAYTTWRGRGPTGAEGGQNLIYVRGQAWALRNRVHTASLAPDAAPEKDYFKTLTDDFIAISEGQHNIVGTSFEGNANWNWGHTTGMGAWTANLGPPTALHFWFNGGPEYLQLAIDKTVTKYACSPWEQNFLIWVLGRAKELGYPTDALLTWLGPNLIQQLTDPNYDPYLVGMYRLPTVRLSDSQYFPDWAGVKSGFVLPFIDDYGHSQTAESYFNANLGILEQGYPLIALAAASQVVHLPGGATAWRWISTRVLDYPGLNDVPKWAILPPTTRPTPPHLM